MDGPIVCLATAHPAKFPKVVRKSLGQLPEQGKHFSIEENQDKAESLITLQHSNALDQLTEIMRKLR